MSHDAPSRLLERVGTAIFAIDSKEYLVTVDYYSNFWEVDRLPDTTASTTSLKLKSYFARYGNRIHDHVVSNNCPQFASKEFVTFPKTWDFEHPTSSPGDSRANGNAQSGVKTAKRFLRKSSRSGTYLYLPFLDHRNIPT